MIAVQEKPVHWAEAFGLSAALHVGVAYLVLTTVVDFNQIFDRPQDTAPSLQITSLAVETSRVTSSEIGAGTDTQSSPQTIEPVADALTTLGPVAETPAPDLETPAAPERIEPVTTATAVTAPETISPLRPETATLAPIAPETSPTPEPVSPVRSNTSVALTPAVAPPPTPELPAEEPTAPPASEASPPTTDTEPDPLAVDLINRIRATVGEACLIALPRQSADGTVSLQILTATEASAGPFADEILSGLNPRPPSETILIDPRQCAALDYIRQGVGYPSGPMSVGLDVTQIPSGTELTGRIANTGGRNVTLLLVDDNGVVQDLGGYLTVAVNTARFAAPLRRVGNVRDTRQLLIALGTTARPSAVTTQNGQTAEVYFDTLSAEIDGNAAIALIPFEVR